MNREEYTEYLKSEHWENTKKRFYASKLHKNKCMVCGSTKNLNIHHKNYYNLGAEKLTDLCLLCQDCHSKVHEMVNNGEGTIWTAPKLLKRKQEKILSHRKIYYKKHKPSGCCAICGSTKKLCQNRNPKTKENRGILCNRCNSILGSIKSDVSFLQKAVDYLKSYE